MNIARETVSALDWQTIRRAEKYYNHYKIQPYRKIHTEQVENEEGVLLKLIKLQKGYIVLNTIFKMLVSIILKVPFVM